MSTVSTRYDLSLLIGHFQPFHLGHQALLAKAFELAPRVLVVVCGAASARSAKAPFSADERIEMIRSCLEPEMLARTRFLEVREYFDEARWAAAVSNLVAREQSSAEARVALLGFGKETAGCDAHWFPLWQRVEVPGEVALDALDLRRKLYTSASGPLSALEAAVPPPVLCALERFRDSALFAGLQAEQLALEQSRRAWGSGPFVTVDALVTAREHVLLVQRGKAPGKGLWALPGGFLEGSERLRQAAVRELEEETGLRLSSEVIESAFRDVAVFDHPERSQRGRTITHAHHFALDVGEVPKVRGADDAAAARWVKIQDLPAMTDQLFEDHFQILDHFLALSG